MLSAFFRTVARNRQPEHLPDWVHTYRSAPRILDRLPWRDVSYSVIDLETTGLDAHRDSILSIGLVEIERGRIILDRSWYTLVQPPTGIIVPAESIRIHRLFRGDLANAPAIEDVLPELLRRLYLRVPVVHFARIDIDFLNQALRKHWNIGLRGPAIDTMRIAQHAYRQQQLLGEHDGMRPVTALSDLAAHANLPVYEQHNALTDALTTAQLFLSQATRLEQRGRGALRHLLQTGRCLR